MIFLRLCVQCSNGKYINVDADHIEREESFVIAYREFMGERELTAVIDLGAVDYLYLSEVRQ